MQLKPRYGTDPIARLELPLDPPAVPMLRQRHRLADLLGRLDESEWAAPSRCAGWSVQDVVAHLVSTNQFWAFSIALGRQGTPSELLASFDPVATPAEMVRGTSEWSVGETLARFVDSVQGIAVALDGIEGDEWDVVAEAPPGHVSLSLVVLHALWDAWIHERDIAIPLGLPPSVETDEVVGGLLYAAALSPGFAAMYGAAGPARQGQIEVRASAPAVRFVVDVASAVTIHDGPAGADAAVLTGDAVALVEGLSLRAPMPCAVAPEHRWMLSGLAEAFDVA